MTTAADRSPDTAAGLDYTEADVTQEFCENPNDVRDMARTSWDRDHDRSASGRQLAAIIASPERGKDLEGVTAPTLVIHGKADKLVRPSGGKATARRVPGARLLLIDGMGHDLPRQVWPRIVQAIVDNARRADVEAPAATA